MSKHTKYTKQHKTNMLNLQKVSYVLFLFVCQDWQIETKEILLTYPPHQQDGCSMCENQNGRQTKDHMY